MVLNTCCWMSRLQAGQEGRGAVRVRGWARPQLVHPPFFSGCEARCSAPSSAALLCASGQGVCMLFRVNLCSVCMLCCVGGGPPTGRCAASRRQSPRRCTRGRMPGLAHSAGRRSAITDSLQGVGTHRREAGVDALLHRPLPPCAKHVRLDPPKGKVPARLPTPGGLSSGTMPTFGPVPCRVSCTPCSHPQAPHSWH